MNLKSTTSNLASKAGVSYTYDTNHPHAVASLSNGNSYTYDANGNMTQRVVNGQTFNLGYDADPREARGLGNRLVSVGGTGLSVAFTYDADGKRVQQVLNNVTTKFIGSHYEIDGTTIIKYYLAGATRVAMRTGTSAPVYFLPDHLGSTSITTDSSGNLIAQLLYKAWGEVMYSSGTTPTDYTYTNQYSNMADFGLMYYNARWYDPVLGRFAQADTIVPGAGNPQAYDKYAYVFNNPVNGIDPSGHMACIDGVQCFQEFGVVSYFTSSASGQGISNNTPSTPSRGHDFGGASQNQANAGANIQVPTNPGLNNGITIVPMPTLSIHIPLYVYDVYYDLRISPTAGSGPITVSPDGLGVNGSSFYTDGYTSIQSKPVRIDNGGFHANATYELGYKIDGYTRGVMFGWGGMTQQEGLFGYDVEGALRYEFHSDKQLILAGVLGIVTVIPLSVSVFPTILESCAIRGGCLP